MDKQNREIDRLKPIIVKKDSVEEAFKKDDTSEILAKAIKSVLSRENQGKNN